MAGYNLNDIISSTSRRTIRTALGEKTIITVLHSSVALQIGDSVSTNAGTSPVIYYEAPILAAQYGGYHVAIKRYVANNIWYISPDSGYKIDNITNTDYEVKYRLTTPFRTRVTGINANGTNSRVKYACPLITLLETGGRYLLMYGGFYSQPQPNQEDPTVITDPSSTVFGYLTFVGELKSGYAEVGGFELSENAFNEGQFIFDHSQELTTDPYAPGGESDLAGGEGDFDNTSVPIDFPELPTLSAVDTGFITLFNPSVSELRSLATYMWGPAFDLENWKKLFANPMDAILGLSIVPVHVPDGGQSNVKVGNIDTGIALNKAASQYVEVDCGTLNINEYWGAYLDYEPYTHVQIFLPYIGTKEVSTDDVMNKPVHVKYHVDILSGSCVAYVKCGESVLYSFNGQCAASIPINGRDYTNVVNSAISLVSSVMGMFAMGQAAGALGSAAGLAKSATSQARLAAGASQMQSGMFSGGANIAASAIDITKPVIQKSGSVSSMAGLLGLQTPYMVLTRPRQCLPANQNKYLGYPSLVTSSLSSCSGFTRVEAIHLENIGATDEEIAEIESILHSGVIF